MVTHVSKYVHGWSQDLAKNQKKTGCQLRERERGIAGDEEKVERESEHVCKLGEIGARGGIDGK